MPRRTSMNDIKQLEALNDLERIVKDKRNDKRAGAKKERRNRHYVKVLIKHQIKHHGIKPTEDTLEIPLDDE